MPSVQKMPSWSHCFGHWSNGEAGAQELGLFATAEARWVLGPECLMWLRKTRVCLITVMPKRPNLALIEVFLLTNVEPRISQGLR